MTVLASFLRSTLRAGKNIIVTGLQNAGKTTLHPGLANELARMSALPPIEREYELLLHEVPDGILASSPWRRGWVVGARQARSPAGEVTLSDLVVDALRMNLRRIIVGEVRGSEVMPMLQAMATGDGSMCTVHSRSAEQAFDRIVTLCLSAAPR